MDQDTPAALRLADECKYWPPLFEDVQAAADELRRQHAEIEALKKALRLEVEKVCGLGSQDPAAFAVPQARVSCDGSMDPGPDYFVSADDASDYERRVGHPLYAAPAPQTAEVTDEQIINAWDSLGKGVLTPGWIYRFARAVLALRDGGKT